LVPLSFKGEGGNIKEGLTPLLNSPDYQCFFWGEITVRRGKAPLNLPVIDNLPRFGNKQDKTEKLIGRVELT